MGVQVLARYRQDVDACSEVIGWDLHAQCLDGAAPGLGDTRFVQPALFVVECLTARAATQDGTPPPQVLAGHSLGEFAALQVAGAFTLLDGVRLVAERGASMSDAATGAMAAVIGLDQAAVTDLIASAGESGLDLANVNSSQQVVVAGPTAAVTRFGPVVREHGGRFVALPVSAPFHSRYMAPARARLERALACCPINAWELPVLSSVTGRAHRPDQVREQLLQQLTSPVNWRDCMRQLYGRGVRAVRELGPGTTLTRFWQQESDLLGAAPTPARPVSCVPGPAPVAPAARLGSAAFRQDYQVELAVLAGSMYRGISSPDLVVRMAQGGMLGFLGTGGMSAEAVSAALADLSNRLGRGGRFGVNLISQPGHPGRERAVVDHALAHDVRYAEVSSYTQVTPEVVRFRFCGAQPNGGTLAPVRQIVAKVSRPEVAAQFLQPARAELIDALLARGDLSAPEAALARVQPVAGDLCVEADSGGHTDGANPLVILPAVLRLRDQLAPVTRVGACGGVGSPESIAALFLMGADFVTTGSINQCTVEAGTSATVKDLLSQLDVTDTAYAPAGDMLELGARVQVVRRGTLFAARANRLLQLARWHDSLESLPDSIRADLQDRVFRHTFEQIWDHVERHHGGSVGAAGPRERMLLTFRWYFAWTTELALRGDRGDLVNYQVHCGPAMGLANQVLAGTGLQRWQDRHVDDVNRHLMERAAELVGPAPAAKR